MWSFKNLKLKEVLLLQDFGGSKGHPIWKQLGVEGHIGIDINIGHLDPIYAFADGEVCYVSDYGDVIIKDDKLEYIYSHLQDYRRFKVGDKVKAGQYIGLQDSNGKSIQPDYFSHLHYSMRELGDETPKTWNFGNKIKNVNNGYDGCIDPNPYCEKVLVRVAKAIELYENMSKEYNNPGALRWSPFQAGQKNGFAYFNTYEDGWNALLYQLRISAEGKSKYYRNYWKVEDFFKIYAPKKDGNDPIKYAKFVNDYCGFKGNEPISDWLLTELEYVRKYSGVHKGKEIWTENILLRLFNNLWGIIFKNR